MALVVKAGLRLLVALGFWLALSLWLGWDRLPIAPGRVTSGPDRGLEQLVGTLWWLGAASVLSLTAKAGVAVLRYFDRGDQQRAARFLLDTVAIAVYLGALISMSAFVFSFPITALFATSSIVAVILGFALQATVADLLAGVALTVEQPYHPGDSISINGTHHGRVIDMNWRATHIVQANGDLLVLPNSLLNRAPIVNHDAPKQAHRESIDMMLRYGDDPAHVAEVLRAAMISVPGVLNAPAPNVEVVLFGQGSITYRLKFWMASAGDDTAICSRVFHAAWKHVWWAGFEWPTYRYANEANDAKRGPIGKADLADLLGHVSLFHSLNIEEREHLSERLTLQRIGHETRLIRQGESGRSLFIICEGAMRVLVTDGKTEREMARLEPGDYVGEASLLTGATRNASIEALTDSAFYEIDKDALAPLIAARQSLADELGLVMAARERTRAASFAANGTQAGESSFGHFAHQIRTFFAKSDDR